MLWRSDRFVCTYAGPALLSDIFPLYGEKPAFDDSKTHWFTVVHLVDRVTGQRLAIVNVHLIPGVIMGGLPVRGIPRHWKLYQRQLARVVAMTRAAAELGPGVRARRLQLRLAPGRGSTATRDLPFRSFRAIGYRSMWATENPGKGRGRAATA